MANMRFPEPEQLLECSWWCEPMHKVERAIAGEEFARSFSVDDFQLAELSERRRPVCTAVVPAAGLRKTGKNQ
jgi:hypothetical protein